MFMEYAQAYVLKVNLCKTQLKNVRVGVQQAMLNLHLDIAF